MMLFDDTPTTKPKGKRAKPEVAEQPETSVEESVGELVTTTVANPVAVFTDGAKFSEFYEKLKAETDRHVPDLTTDKGRKAVASLAFKVTKAKTSLDKAGLGLTEEWRNKISLVNASRKTMTAELDQLADEVRRPLTEWEKVENARVAANAETIIAIRADAIVQDDDTAATVEARGRAIHAMTFIEPQWTVDEAVKALDEQAQAVKLLITARSRLAREEADRLELERLRAEAEERAAREDAERLERERIAAEEAAARAEQERIEREAREAEERRIAAERAEAERIAAAEQAAREQAQREADERAEADRQDRERQHQAELDAERERAAVAAREAEAAIAAEREAAAKAERERQAERDREAEAQRQRDAAEAVERQRIADEEAAAEKRRQDQTHRTAIKTAAKEAMMRECGLDEDTARKVVTAIVAGDIPAVGVAF